MSVKVLIYIMFLLSNKALIRVGEGAKRKATRTRCLMAGKGELWYQDGPP